MDRSISQLLDAALKAEREGVPVDWKEVAMHTFNSANAYFLKLEATNGKSADENQHSGKDPGY